jgi:hypothetical protein
MDSPATSARRNAISIEIKKDGLQQRQSGDWMLRFTVAASDMDQRIVAAAMGTRFVCVLVEVNDDETPVDHVAIERGKWRALGATKQAGIRCKDPVFWAYLSEECGLGDEVNEIGAAIYVRNVCGVTSRRELDKPGNSEARRIWFDLDNQFQAWRAMENA